MRWIQTEYVLKGIFLGLLAFAALQAAGSESPDWATTGKLGLCVAGGLAQLFGYQDVARVSPPAK